MARILVVEDDTYTRSGLSQILLEEGYEVDTAADAEQALSKLRETPVDVMLSDYRLPDLSGTELHVKARTLRPQVQTIIMTAYDLPEQAAAALELGVTSWFTKPVNVDGLLSRIHMALRHEPHLEENPMT